MSTPNRLRYLEPGPEVDSNGARSDERPLVTFALFTYNQERFVAEAVRGALAQTYSPLEIIINDDCSSDGTFSIIEHEVATYEGPHKICVNRRSQNIGLARSINHVMELAKGDLIVVAAGDDLSLALRVSKLVALYLQHRGKALSFFSNAYVTNESGTIERLFYQDPPIHRTYTPAQAITHGFWILGATHAWDRAVFDVFGPLPHNVKMEDVAIPFRSTLLGSICYLHEPLVCYRRHSQNMHLDLLERDLEIDQWYKTLYKTNEAQISSYRSWLKDLEIATQLYPERNGQVSRLQRAAQRLIRRTAYKSILLQNAPLYKKLVITLRMIALRSHWRIVIQWILTFFFPSLYLRRIKRNSIDVSLRRKPV